MGGLPAGSYTFTVQALNAYGLGSATTTAAAVVTGATSTYGSTVRADLPSLYYRLGDTTTALMADSSGNASNGVYVPLNVTQGQTGAIPGDPTTSVVDKGQSNGYGFSGANVPVYFSPRTFELWLNSTTNEGSRWIFTSGQQGTDQGFNLQEINPSVLEVSAINDDHYFALPYPIDDGVWHLIDVTTNGTSLTVYLDGVAVGSSRWNGLLDTLPGSVNIGNYYGGCCGVINTQLQDFAVFSYALTAAQLTAHFAASGYSRPAAPPTASATGASNQATVIWSAPTGSNTAVKGYLITALSGTTKKNAVAVGGSATSSVVGGLPAGSYTFTVQAFNAFGLGAAKTTTAVAVTGNSSTYASTVRALAPSGYYELGDSTTGLMADSSGNQIDGVYVPSSVTLSQTGAIPSDPTTSVTGNGNYVGTVLSAKLPLYNQSRTVEGWIKPNNGGEMYMAGWGVQSTAEAFDVSTSANAVNVRGYNDDLGFSTSTNLANGSWHFIVVTATATSATVYVDGVSLGSQTFPTSLDTLSTGQLVVGGYTTQCCGENGGLAQLAVFPRVLTAAQVASQFSAGTAPAPPPLAMSIGRQPGVRGGNLP
jgi:hypothetical protein